MSCEDLKKQHIRTQGKYSDMDLKINRARKHKVTPADKEVNEKKVAKKNSSESRKLNNFFMEEHSSGKCKENWNFLFSELENHKPFQICEPGKHIISCTETGESVIYYEPDFLNATEAWELFDYFNDTTLWFAKNIVIHNREYAQPRLVSLYGPYAYSYSGITLEAAEMPEILVTMKQKVEAFLKEHGINTEFNSVLLGLYRNEKDSVAWHSDDELSLGFCPTIASLSLGEVRRFEIKRKKRYHEEYHLELPDMFMNLNHGSLVVMDGGMQKDWQHRIPKEYHSKLKSMNLSFLTVFPVDNSCQSEKEFTKQYAGASNEHFTKDLFDRNLLKRHGTGNPQNEKSNEKFQEECDDDTKLYVKQNDDKKKDQSLVQRCSNVIDDYKTNKQFDIQAKSREDDENEVSIIQLIKYEDKRLKENPRSPGRYEKNSQIHDDGHKRVPQEENSDRRNDLSPRYNSNEEDPEQNPGKKQSNNTLNLAENKCVLKKPISGYDKVTLEDLLFHDINLMSGEELQNYARNLTDRVLEILDQFKPSEKEELEFLCDLTDGSNSTKNQKLISIKMANIVVDYVDRKNSSE